jgi:hypothetical protein
VLIHYKEDLAERTFINDLADFEVFKRKFLLLFRHAWSGNQELRPSFIFDFLLFFDFEIGLYLFLFLSLNDDKIVKEVSCHIIEFVTLVRLS